MEGGSSLWLRPHCCHSSLWLLLCSQSEPAGDNSMTINCDNRDNSMTINQHKWWRIVEGTPHSHCVLSVERALTVSEHSSQPHLILKFCWIQIKRRARDEKRNEKEVQLQLWPFSVYFAPKKPLSAAFSDPAEILNSAYHSKSSRVSQV